MARERDWQEIVAEVLEWQEQGEVDSAPPPAIPQWYVKDWLGDRNVMVMDFTARGMHHHLLMVAWQESPPCSLPDDDLMLRAYCGHPEPDSWAHLWPMISRGWRKLGDRWWNLGLCKAYLRAMKVRLRSSRAGRKGGRPKKAPAQKSKAAAFENEAEPSNSKPLQSSVCTLQSTGGSSPSPTPSPSAAAAEGHSYLVEVLEAFHGACGPRKVPPADLRLIHEWKGLGIPAPLVAHVIRSKAEAAQERGDPVQSIRYFDAPVRQLEEVQLGQPAQATAELLAEADALALLRWCADPITNEEFERRLRELAERGDIKEDELEWRMTETREEYGERKRRGG